MDNIEIKELTDSEIECITETLLILLDKKNQVTVIKGLLSTCPETEQLFATFQNDIQHQAGFLISMYKRGVNLMINRDHDELYEIFARHPKYNISIAHVKSANDSILQVLTEKIEENDMKQLRLNAWRRCQENFILIMEAAYTEYEKEINELNNNNNDNSSNKNNKKVQKNRKRIFRTVSVKDIETVSTQFKDLVQSKAESAACLCRILSKDSLILKVFHSHNIAVADQAEVIFDMIGTAINQFSDIDTLIPWLKNLGNKHANMNINPRLLSSMKPHLLSWLTSCLGFSFTDEMRQSWTKVLSLMIGLMIEGMRHGGDKNSSINSMNGDHQSVMSVDGDGNAVELKQEDIDRCQSAWKSVQKVLGIAVKSFYKDLIASKAEIRNLFSTSNMEEQANKLVRAIGSTIEMLDDFETLVPILEELGRRHVYYNVLPSHFKYLKLAWFRMLENALALKWNAEMIKSWNIVWYVITKVMKTSLEDAYLLYTPPDPEKVQLKLLINHIDRIETQHMTFWADIWYAAFTNDNPSQSAAFGPEAYNSKLENANKSNSDNNNNNAPDYPSWSINVLNGMETSEQFRKNGEQYCKRYETSSGKNEWYLRGNVRGSFSQAFDIHAFPFDTHQLQIKFSLLVDESLATFDDEKLRVRLMPFKLDMMGGTDWDVFTPQIYTHKDSAVAGGSSSGKKYTHCIASMAIARKWKHHIWDTFVPLILIEVMVFAVYAASVHPLAKRMAVVATLLLTLFTFKTMVAESMPPTPYSTIMDYFFHVAKIFLMLHFYAQVAIILLEDQIEDVSLWIGCGLFVIWSLVHCILFVKCYTLVKKYPKEENGNTALMAIAKSAMVSHRGSMNTSYHQSCNNINNDKSINVRLG